MTEQPPESPADAALVQRRQEMQLELWQARQLAQLEREKADLAALDVNPDGPMTPRQRLAHARMLAQSGIVPAGFRGGAKPGAEPSEHQLNRAAADIVLAGEIGAQLGFPPAIALLHLQVVEGNVQLKPSSARGLLLQAGCTFQDEEAENRYGVPVAHVILFRRPEWTEPARVKFTISRAERAGLVELERDENGEVTRVRARSKDGRPLPWELYTADMLRHRCTSRVIDMYARDLTAGLNLDADVYGDMERGEIVQAREAAVRREWQQDAPAGLHRGTNPTTAASRARDTQAAYDPTDDLDLIEKATGSRAYRKHANSRARRRTKVQMAADRLVEYYGDTSEPAPPAPDVAEPVDAEIVEPEGAIEDPGPPLAGMPSDAYIASYGVTHGPGIDEPPLDQSARAPLADTMAAELAAAWSAVYDLFGVATNSDDGYALSNARKSVYSWIRTELPDATGLDGPDDLRPDHVRKYLRAMEPDLDDVADADD